METRLTLRKGIVGIIGDDDFIVFSRELIYERVWRESSLYGSKSVNDLICSIRKKMGLSPKDTDYIKTVKGVGYCFAP